MSELDVTGSEPKAPKRKRAGLVQRFISNKRGSVAIEFAILAIPFTMLTFAVIETSVSFGAQQIMANSTDNIARAIRTGQLRAADVSPSSIKNAICQDLSLLVRPGCPNLFVDLKVYPNFPAVPTQIPFNGSGDLVTSGFSIAAGGPLEIHSLRVFYKWPVITDLLSAYISNQSDNTILMFSMMTWRNEPFPI